MPKNVLTDLRKVIGSEIRERFDTRKKFRIPPDERTFETVEELKKFIEAVPLAKYKAFFKLLAWSGIRKGEALRIKTTDFDFENEDLYVRVTKNADNYVRVPLPSKLSYEIKQLIEYGVLFGECPFSNCEYESKELFRRTCFELAGKYDRTYGKSSTNRQLYFFNINCFRKFFQSLIFGNSSLIGRALHDTVDVASKYYLSKINQIRRIVNELY